MSLNQTNVIQGNNLQAQVNVTTNGTPENIALSSNTGSSGINCTFEPSWVTSNFTSTLTMSVPDSTPTGNYTITVTALGGGQEENASCVVSVLSANVTVSGTMQLLPNMARTNRNLITSNLNVVEGSYRKVWNWTITFDLKNTGNTPITINNLVINGQPYNDISPVPSINPSIKTGYTLSPQQSATMSVKVINQPIALYQGTNSLYILTTLGDSLEVYLGT